MEVTEDGVYSSVECDEGVFRGIHGISGGVDEMSSLVCVDNDEHDMDVMCTGEEKGVDEFAIIGLMHKEEWVDGIGFEVNLAVGRNEEVIFSLVCV